MFIRCSPHHSIDPYNFLFRLFPHSASLIIIPMSRLEEEEEPVEPTEARPRTHKHPPPEGLAGRGLPLPSTSAPPALPHDDDDEDEEMEAGSAPSRKLAFLPVSLRD